ncbi:MAG: hypothetical protein IT331_07910 [Anaerolineae bacterium]|nr:hypothetical protein [Anaerolineae bacterium]
MRQFLSAANAPPLTLAELERAQAVLNPEALALYQSMPPGDQRHSLAIFDALRARGYNDRPLLQAALLHDVAKRNIGLAYRVGAVLLNRMSPKALARWASENPESWRYPFYLLLHHPELGAELAAHVGADPKALELIRAHQTAAPHFKERNAARLEQWHHALKELDDMN